MAFGLDLDVMAMWWTDGDRDLSEALAAIEGFQIARAGAGLVEPERTSRGRWERKVEYTNGLRERARAARKAKKQEARCEG